MLKTKQHVEGTVEDCKMQIIYNFKFFIFLQSSSTSIDNEVQSLKILVLRSLSHYNKAYHTKTEYCKNCLVSTALSPQAFQSIFKPFIHYFIVKKSGKMCGQLTPGQFMKCLFEASNSIISAQACIQARIFSVVKVAFWEKSEHLYGNEECPK